LTLPKFISVFFKKGRLKKSFRQASKGGYNSNDSANGREGRGIHTISISLSIQKCKRPCCKWAMLRGTKNPMSDGWSRFIWWLNHDANAPGVVQALAALVTIVLTAVLVGVTI
jgi:hypothetical protein